MNINVLGCGNMGKQIVAFFYLGGFEIKVWDIAKIDEEGVNKYIRIFGKQFNPSKTGTIKYVDRLEDLSDVVTIESVAEDLAIKKDVYSSISQMISSPYFTNSSSYVPREIGNKVNAMHFFNPISVKLAELYCINNDIKMQIKPLLDYMKYMDFTIVDVRQNRGISAIIFCSERYQTH